MLCPLAKANGGLIWYTYTPDASDDDKAKMAELQRCDGSNCGWWDSTGKQCSMVTIAIELRIIRQYGAKVGD